MGNIVIIQTSGHKERKAWVDWMKVFGMFTIILGHLFPEGLVPFIYSFSVPLFFIISGYLNKTNHNIKKCLSKVFDGLVIPYTLIWIINVSIYAVITKSIPPDLLEKIVGFIFGFESYIGALWFVYTLILVKIIAIALDKVCSNTKSTLIAMTSLSTACICGMIWLNSCDQQSLLKPLTDVWPNLSIMFQGRIAWSWTNVLCAMPFFTFGIILSKLNVVDRSVETISRFKPQVTLALALIAFVILYPLSELNGNMFMYDCGYGSNLLLCYVNAFIGTTAIFFVSVSIQPYMSKALIVLASGSIIVLGFHGIPLNITMLKFPALITMGGEICGSILYSIVLYMMFIPIVRLLSLYCPIMLGYRKV